jgi:GNAT superfamily N-acetyltransferase
MGAFDFAQLMKGADVWIECFEKDERFDGDDVEALIEQLLAHVRATHDVPYPDAELRLWARNFADASVRGDGPTARLPSIGSIEVHPVTEERIDDWLRFFDRDAFADNPDWASCYCLHPHVGDASERPWRDVRAEMIERLRSGATLGYLAYVDGRAAGWVNASLRSTYAKYSDVDPAGPAPDTVVGVSCFIIAPPYRRHGVSSALLDRVVADGATRGARHVEGYPRRSGAREDAESFCGPRSMFDTRDFTPAEEHDGYTVVRRPV